MLRLTFCLTGLLTTLICFSQTVSLSPLYNSVGYTVALPEGYDVDQTAHCFIKYRKSTETTFRDGMEADRVLIAGSSQFRGSLFYSTKVPYIIIRLVWWIHFRRFRSYQLRYLIFQLCQPLYLHQ
jgi:hypothetical protein